MRRGQGSAAICPFVATVALGLLLSSAEPAAAADSKPATHTVTISGVQFEPQSLTVRVGDTIVWVNRDPFPHTVTAVGKRFDSHEIAVGHSWTYRARKAGIFSYACTLHPTMSGTLRVE